MSLPPWLGAALRWLGVVLATLVVAAAVVGFVATFWLPLLACVVILGVLALFGGFRYG